MVRERELSRAPEPVLAFPLVGSVATGLCTEDSDVDIAVVCEGDVYSAISAGAAWASGRPSETQIDGVEVHWYGVSLEDVERGLADLDDIPFDARKRLFETGLRGRIGRTAEEQVRRLLADLAALAQMASDGDLSSFRFRTRLAELIALVSEEARKQGFRVGLDRPNTRHVEE